LIQQENSLPEAFADPGIVLGYHAHLYYAPDTRPTAERLRAAIGENFPQARIGSSMFSCTPSRMTASRITRNLRFGSGRLYRCASRCCGEGRGRVDPAEPGSGGSLYSTEGEQDDDDDQQ
jgi:hypothetical protein